jgi:SAM-dependent methyltransferase
MIFNHPIVDKIYSRLEPYIRFLNTQQIVSVGSGTGRVEAKMMELGWAKDIICVDINP